MVQRVKQAAKKSNMRSEAGTAAVAPVASSRAPQAGSQTPARTGQDRLPDRVTALERERDGLQTALSAALARVTALEAAQAQVANRIGWMIEALQTLKNEGR